MDKNIFKARMNMDFPKFTERTLKETINMSIQTTKGKVIPYYNLVIVMEELNELGQQVSKFCRGKCEHLDLVEEMADVTIGMEYLKQICKVSDEELHKAVQIKLDRLNAKIKENGYYM